MLTKKGSTLQITKVAASLQDALGDRLVTKTLEPKSDDFLYFVARGLTADVENSNGDLFSRAELKKSYETFIGKGLYLNHDADDVQKAVGKIVDAWWIEKEGDCHVLCLCKVDKKNHEQLASKIASGIIDSVSMGCSCEESECSICHKKMHTEADFCEHMAFLGRMIDVEGKKQKVISINSGIHFTELSLVANPADVKAKLLTVYAQADEQIRTQLRKVAGAMGLSIKKADDGIYSVVELHEDPDYGGLVGPNDSNTQKRGEPEMADVSKEVEQIIKEEVPAEKVKHEKEEHKDLPSTVKDLKEDVKELDKAIKTEDIPEAKEITKDLKEDAKVIDRQVKEVLPEPKVKKEDKPETDEVKDKESAKLVKDVNGDRIILKDKVKIEGIDGEFEVNKAEQVDGKDMVAVTYKEKERWFPSSKVTKVAASKKAAVSYKDGDIVADAQGNYSVSFKGIVDSSFTGRTEDEAKAFIDGHALTRPATGESTDPVPAANPVVEVPVVAAEQLPPKPDDKSLSPNMKWVLNRDTKSWEQKPKTDQTVEVTASKYKAILIKGSNARWIVLDNASKKIVARFAISNLPKIAELADFSQVLVSRIEREGLEVVAKALGQKLVKEADSEPQGLRDFIVAEFSRREITVSKKTYKDSLSDGKKKIKYIIYPIDDSLSNSWVVNGPIMDTEDHFLEKACIEVAELLLQKFPYVEKAYGTFKRTGPYSRPGFNVFYHESAGEPDKEATEKKADTPTGTIHIYWGVAFGSRSGTKYQSGEADVPNEFTAFKDLLENDEYKVFEWCLYPDQEADVENMFKAITSGQTWAGAGETGECLIGIGVDKADVKTQVLLEAFRWGDVEGSTSKRNNKKAGLPESVNETDKQKYFEYLDELRESGDTNMFGARPYLMEEFPELDKKKASEVLSEWMKTFSQRHPKKAGANDQDLLSVDISDDARYIVYTQSDGIGSYCTGKQLKQLKDVVLQHQEEGDENETFDYMVISEPFPTDDLPTMDSTIEAEIEMIQNMIAEHLDGDKGTDEDEDIESSKKDTFRKESGAYDKTVVFEKDGYKVTITQEPSTHYKMIVQDKDNHIVYTTSSCCGAPRMTVEEIKADVEKSWDRLLEDIRTSEQYKEEYTMDDAVNKFYKDKGWDAPLAFRPKKNSSDKVQLEKIASEKQSLMIEKEAAQKELISTKAELESIKDRLSGMEMKAAVEAKTRICQKIALEAFEKGLLPMDEHYFINLVKGNKRPEEARALAARRTIDAHAGNLLKMDDIQLKAYADSIKQISKSASKPSDTLKTPFTATADLSDMGSLSGTLRGAWSRAR